MSAAGDAVGDARHIRDAGVDLDGNIIAIGAMRHPIDHQGHFQVPAADHVRLSRPNLSRIVRCRAVRDASGFLRSEDIGPELHLPQALTAIIDRALRHGAQEPLIASLTHQDGQLSDSTSRIKTLIQPLSDWRLRINDVDGAITVAMSAALHATMLQDWNTSTANHWPTGGTQERIEVTFTVDAITRIACFGCYIPSIEPTGLGKPVSPVRTTLAALDIATAPVGTFTAYGMDGDRWISFYQSEYNDHMITFGEREPPLRTATGFVADSHGHRWPRIGLQGIDMGVIAAHLASGPSMRLTCAEGLFGHLLYGRDEPTEDIVGSELDIALDEAGLGISYRLQVPGGSRVGRFVLPWEVLILRYPAFTRRRAEYQNFPKTPSNPATSPFAR